MLRGSHGIFPQDNSVVLIYHPRILKALLNTQPIPAFARASLTDCARLVIYVGDM